MITYPFSFIKGFDSNAKTYIDAVIAAGGTLSSNEQYAINNFYVGIKTDGIYSKLYFMHLFLGGVANSNKLDALNPGGPYDLGFNGTWTHSTGGSYSPQTIHPSYPNYANTNYDISTNNASCTIATNWSFGAMMSNVDRTKTGFGYMGAGPGDRYMLIGSDGNNSIENWFPDQGGIAFAGISSAAGFINGVFRSGASAWESGAIQAGQPSSGGLLYGGARTSTYTQSGIVTPIYYNAISNTGYPTGGNYLFGWAGQYLTRTLMNQFLIRINDLQTAFSRNILT